MVNRNYQTIIYLLFFEFCSCAEDTKRGNTKVLVKKLPRIFDAKEDAKKAYREIQILKFVSHDNIAKLIDIYPNSGKLEDFCDV